ncbi:c-type cytochrome [Tabrizicola sp.]|uniref:c-type cytochrome n=1 Tax=Tabrizicola sp. TaxID=2005166 RepID=UPI001A3B894E|nr:c-type cytochrome [Tabrizicola sp.]MBL9072851.1 c-type cytochrome [Tabrizicola sp.]
MFKQLLPILALAIAAPAFADPDAHKGEENFKKCKSCHSIIAPDGTEIQKGGKTGPNLFGVVGRAAASAADFKYGEGMLELNAKGVVWDEAQIAAYLADPTAWVKATTGDDAAKSKMSFKLPDAEAAADMAAYLATVK